MLRINGHCDDGSTRTAISIRGLEKSVSALSESIMNLSSIAPSEPAYLPQFNDVGVLGCRCHSVGV